MKRSSSLSLSLSLSLLLRVSSRRIHAVCRSSSDDECPSISFGEKSSLLFVRWFERRCVSPSRSMKFVVVVRRRWSTPLSWGRSPTSRTRRRAAAAATRRVSINVRSSLRSAFFSIAFIPTGFAWARNILGSPRF